MLTGSAAAGGIALINAVGNLGGFLGPYAMGAIQDATGTDVPWWIFALAIFAVVWALTHFGIRISMRTTAVFGAIEILIMLALAITFLVHPGHGSSYTAPLQPSHSPHMFGGILAGMVFSVLALSGFVFILFSRPNFLREMRTAGLILIAGAAVYWLRNSRMRNRVPTD